MIADIQQWLEQRADLNPEQAYQWALLIHGSLCLLDRAKLKLREPEEWAAFLGGCRCRNVSLPTEPELTSGLGDQMQEIVDSDLGGDPWDGILPSYEKAIPGHHAHGIRKTRADFSFRRRIGRRTPMYFYVEAKSLRRLQHVNGRLLSSSGIGCFLTLTPPYGSEPAAGLVGYVLAGTRNSYQLEILTKVQGAVRISQVGRCAASDHERENGAYSPVTIVHELLDFT